MRSRATAGRTTLFAGATLLAALALSAYVQPGSLLLSLATTVGVATVLSVLVAVAGLPGLLALLGRARQRRRDRRLAAGLALPGRGDGGRARSRRPGLAAVLIAIPLLLLAAPALGLTTAAPGIDELPDLERGAAERGSDRRRRRPGLGSALRPRSPPRRKARSRPPSGSPCSAAGSAGSPPSPASAR